jgi:hypothetical protein
MTKIHSGVAEHSKLPKLPCSDRPTHHLRDNNLLALQAAFQCGTVHHACAGVSLAKPSDTVPVAEFDYLFTPTWLNTVKLAASLDKIFPPDQSDKVYDALTANDLRAFSWMLRKQRRRAEGGQVIKAVSLRKPYDDQMLYRPGRVPGSYVGKINRYLDQWSGPLSDQTREDLRRNDLRGLDNLFYLIAHDPSPGE